ncbi:integrase arm-type DNA-binding domain-containing protein [Ochrobactrum sp. GPK 3]
MSKTVLTIKFVEAVKPEAKGRLEIPDAGLPGMYLVVQPSGAKSWAYRYRIGGKPKKLTIGSVLAKREAGEVEGDLPFGIPMTLSEARRATRQAMQLVAEGIDPAAEKKAAKEGVITPEEQARVAQEEAARLEKNKVKYLSEDFVERYAKPKNKSWKEVQRQFTVNVLPTWGDRDIASITKRDVIELLDKIIDGGAPTMANRVLATLKKFFGWLTERDVIPSSPANGIGKPAPEVSRDRVLSDDEIRLLWKVTGDIGQPFGPYVRLLLLTGQRLNEVAAMQRDELSLDAAHTEWTMGKTRTKNGKAHVVALAPSAVTLIKEIPAIGDKGYVFTTTGETPISGFSKAKTAIDTALLAAAKEKIAKAGGDPDKVVIEPWVFHDLRRTMASGMARIGIALPVIERCLNHVSGSFGGIVGVYQQHEYRVETRAALRAWAKLVDDVVNNRDASNVIPMKKST